MVSISTSLINIVIVAVVMICFDVITGVVSAFATGTFKSSIMRKGGWHKLMLLVAVCFGVFLDVAQQMVNLGINVPAGNCICGYIILMEACSILENINKAAPGTIPQAVLKMFNTAKEEKEGDADDR